MAAPTPQLMLRLTAVLVLAAVAVGVIHLRVASLRDSVPSFPGVELRIGIDASYPPFAVDTGGSLYGIDVEIGRALAARLDTPVRFISMGIDGLYDALRADQVDVVISALQPEPWRTQEVRYTRPYFNAGLVLISPAEVPLVHMEALTGRTLAYEFGGTADAEARRWLRRIAPFETRPYELPVYALDAVRLGQADAALVDATSAYLYRQQYPDWAHHLAQVTDLGYVAAVRLDRTRTFRAVDWAMGDLLRDGTITHILHVWFEAG